MAADGRRTASDGREAAFGGRSADRQRRGKKKHLIEAAPFGRLDQMLRMAVQGRVLGGLCRPIKYQGSLISLGAELRSQNRKNVENQGVD